MILLIALFLINPGIPGKGNFSKEFYKNYKGKIDDLQICKKCNILILKKFKGNHCKICNICIIKYDHHCPWIGKCIGKNSIIIFYFFLIFLFFFILNGNLLFFIYIKNTLF